MTKTTIGGIGLIVFALAMLIYNATDTIADLKNWHDATTPAIVAVLLKQAASVVMGAIGGTLLPQVGSAKP